MSVATRTPMEGNATQVTEVKVHSSIQLIDSVAMNRDMRR